MRIRSIRPEFWRSGAISSLALEDRLLFIGIWSYVDDNGVGLDKLSNLVADLFADDVEKDPRETFERVSRGLASLSAAGRIKRYSVAGRSYLYVVNWDEHQKIDRPGKERYPLPTREDAAIRETVATPSRDIRDTPSTGEGEKGRRGEGEKAGSEEPDSTDPKIKRRAPRKPIPDGWSPTDRHREYATNNRIDLTHEADKFRNGALANDRRYADWDRAFTNWLVDGKAKGWAKILPLDVAERQARTEQTEAPFVPLLQMHGRAAR